ncbi:4'-phosphopantetheinyl transferase superfamily protein [Streptomyces sp. CSDS2]|uniref:4'-phosphopantetheinyl transferase family protein n=1 Tax=Streptomyces sp. CSDS2 TaxID=3055051 RepID=UPI0025B01270|nr:4'-phosphopantetheinyl transferase superfamily protein [Streptomyces sp. CSDS2]MDN3259828.1 4'-phosphopantetheinyl transferase superfamily protein [Streptomyces sp. CSDS2]
MDVHLSMVDESEPAAAADWSLLTEAERDRAARMSCTGRPVWIRSRVLLRTVVARHLGCAPREVRLGRDPRGRPVLPDAPGTHISLAHTTGCCAVALSTAGPVGVDIERVRPVSLPDGLARRVLGPAELDEWSRVPAPDRTRWLLRRWTWKEALLKAEGSGLPGGLRSFEVRRTAAGLRVQAERRRPERWWVAEVPAGWRHVAAVAGDLRTVAAD